MRMIIQTLPMILISSLVGCHSTYGNVVPQTGPSMEQVYDSMGVPQDTTNNTSAEKALPQIRADAIAPSAETGNIRPIEQTKIAGFTKVPNPELRLYVYPHLAGASEIPIPGYSTAFNAYERDHYALPQDTVRQ